MSNQSDRDSSTQTPTQEEDRNQEQVPQPPKGGERLKWLGPSFLWMLSAAGSGELLFTPRIAALYGYSLLWALLAAVILKWFINGEVGRFTVCTGATILQGFKQLPGPKNWTIWLILLPQAVVAVSTVAGLSGAAATALVLVTGGSLQLWTVIIITVTAAIVLFGQYNVVEKISSYVGIARTIAVVTAAIFVFPSFRQLADGLVPQIPQNIQYQEILPWLGFMLAGAAGLMWYSYWVEARGYGAASVKGRESIDPKQLNREEKKAARLDGSNADIQYLSRNWCAIGSTVFPDSRWRIAASAGTCTKRKSSIGDSGAVIRRYLGTLWLLVYDRDRFHHLL